MAIRITGMYSGLDTESIINELASAQSAKKNSLVKAQTKLSWKQDAWKALNTRIYSFYTNTLSDLRFQSSFQKKATKVSNSNVVSVITGSTAVNGVQTLQVDKMAKSGYLTGGEISKADGTAATSSSKLSDLGFSGSGSFSVVSGGTSTEITVDENTTISSVVSQLQSAGLNASFDEKNQRIFVSSKDTGADKNFTLNGNNEGGLNALSSLGLLVADDLTSNSEYTKWAGYATDTAAYDEVVADEVTKRAASYKTQNEKLEKTNTELQEKIDALKAGDSYPDGTTAAALYDQLYGEEVEVTGDDGSVTTERNGGLQKELDDLNADLTAAQENLKSLQDSGASEDEIAQAEEAVTNASADVSAKQADFDALKAQYTDVKAVEDYQKQIETNDQTIQDNETYFTVDADGNAVGTSDLEAVVRAEYDEKIRTAQAALHGTYASLASSTATKVQGQDAEIYLNGAYFKSDSNTFEINGLTMTMLSETNGEEVTLSTDDDTDGIYDMIKNFFTQYNSLINEMDTLYNADSASSYEPLLSDEKDGMSDSEIEEWEATIKASLLRRDSTLGTLSDSITSIMLQGVTVNGKTMYLSDFGINTLGYFSADDNERHAYHIDGDEDDSNTKNETDVLKSMIASDPDTVISFFTSLSNSLYTNLTNKMSASTLSSAFTVYNDKELSDEYDDYTDKISDQEDKLNDLIDKWYSKFSTMETALSKLDSKSSAVSSMLGS